MEWMKESTVEVTNLHRKAEDSKRCFSCPEGYLDGLVDDIMSRIPCEKEDVELRANPSWWVRLKPSLYLAASFLTLILGFQGLRLLSDSNEQVAVQHTKTLREEEYARYYEDYATRLVGNEAERNLDKVLSM